ncbi:MFS transporter [Burkholderia sp. Ax-1719]|uniref:MFS transporter n=1 Tax=Burkholderia sp. Ax-1719 TaxID=2608334 RepID=UPI001423FB19|nr:MFS transporter [Burkholderia sp. Ax-1719]NIE64169.1 MFS transporter [Burkholderia sp. Ax-1719]
MNTRLFPPRAQTAAPTRHTTHSVLAIIGILLVAANLRAAVAALSPIYDLICKSYLVSPQAQGVLGSLPALAFSVFGCCAPAINRRLGLERGIALAMLLVCVGDVGRAWLSGSVWSLGVFSLMALGGMGMANVLLPATIKRYLPQRVGAMTAAYCIMSAIGAAAPSLLAVPVAHLFGWRVSVGAWSLLAVAAALPWLLLHRPQTTAPGARDGGLTRLALRWPQTWALVVVFAGGAWVMYALLAWLPTMLVQTAHVAPAHAGAMLALYSLVGLAHNLVVPNLLATTRRPERVVIVAAACTVTGTLGLAYCPQLALLWVIPAGLGAMAITIGLTLINLRSRTESGTTALSGVMQAIGYLIASAGPWMTGKLYALSGGWLVPCWLMAATGVLIGIAGFAATRQGFLEDRAGQVQ